MISLDPESGASSPKVLRKVARDYGGTAGVYASVVAEGVVHRGDSVELLD
jgi:MOSC domain-containing protein YiiM